MSYGYEIWGDENYRPMKVVAEMEEPIVYSEDLIHLDGLLAAAAFAALDDRTRRRIPPLASEWVVDLPLPLARWKVPVDPDSWPGDKRMLWPRRTTKRARARTELWGWCASAEVATWSMRGVAEIRKRPPLDEMRRYGKDRTVTTGAGPLKGYDLALPTVFAHTIEWYALGDPRKVEEMLAEHIRAIGKKRTTGWGRVRRWRVLQCESDWSIVDGHGRLMRRMPSSVRAEGVVTRGAIRPPYHHPSRVVEAVEPLRYVDGA